MHMPAYERDPFATSLETRILKCGEEKADPSWSWRTRSSIPREEGSPVTLAR